jgi:hypothetical protein
MFHDFMVDCITEGLQRDAMARLDKFVAACKEMEAAARSRFPTLAPRTIE